MNPVCPSDEILREILQNNGQETRSTEWLAHMSTCRNCQHRISDWQQQTQYKDLVQAAANYDIEYFTPAAHSEISPLRDVIPGEPDGVTSNYQEAALRRIGNYELLELIGTGGSGNVYKARHVHLGRNVAIKLLLPQFSGSHVARLRFFREMKSIGALDHPYLVRADDAGEYEQTLYLAMELVVGENVDSFARRIGPLPVPDACEIIRQASIGLQHIHENGLVHRDLKPSNLLLSRNGVKIADLGLALLTREAKVDHRLTGTETVLGTTDYMAPEQAEGSHEVDIRADMYSLGCTLFRLLAGYPPYSGPAYDTALKKMVAHASHPVPDIQQLRDDIPSELSAIIQRLMSKDREQRYAAPIAIAHELEPFCGDLDLRKLGITAPIQPHSVARGSTVKDQTDPLKASATKVLTTDDAAVHRYFIPHRWVMIGIIGMVALMLMFSIREFIKEPVIDGHSPEVPKASDPRKGPVIAVAGEKPPPNAPEKPLRTDLEIRWEKNLGFAPQEVFFPERRQFGADVQFSDSLRALAVQSQRTVRFIQLGNLGEDDDMTISVDMLPVTSRVVCGIFVGLQVDASDKRQPTQLHQITVSFPPPSPRGLCIARCHGQLHPESGYITTGDSDLFDVMVPDPKGKLSLELQLNSKEISSIKVNKEECAFRKRFFVDPPYSGPFGLLVEEGTVWFTDPKISKKEE